MIKIFAVTTVNQNSTRQRSREPLTFFQILISNIKSKVIAGFRSERFHTSYMTILKSSIN